MKKNILYITMMFFVIFSCSEEENIADLTPQNVTNILIQPMNTRVKLTWTNPEDKNFLKTKITYNDKIIEIDNTKESVLIDQLENGLEYTFYVYTEGVNGISSETVEVKATPDEYVTRIESSPISSGSYERLNTTIPISVTINNDQYKRELTAGGDQYIWEGTMNFENDTTYKFDFKYYRIGSLGQVHIADIIQRKNAAFNFELADSTFYIENAFEKIKGKEDFLPGTYRSYIKDVSSDEPSYSDTTYFYIEINEDGNVNYTTSGGYSHSFSWTNEELVQDKYLFISANNRIYLVKRGWTILYYKK